ncbi:MAG: phosphatase PAP2 family protein [Armatimonadetes bacterium]|nr:phosphatase PAP2 family protein [Armatimonadota bacterium]
MRAAAGQQVGALWQRGQPWVVLAAGLLLATVGLLLFAVIATQLPEPSTRVAEQVVLGAVRPLRQPALTRVMVGLSALGSPWVLLILAGLAAVPRLVRGDRLAALLLLVVLAGGGLLNLLLKVLFQRPRPVAPEVTAAGYAFPSGHAMLALCFYGFLAYLAARSPWPAWLRAVAAAACVLLALAVGFSRVYLGVHWPSDVAAGFVAGAAWLGACIAADEWARHHAGRRR